MDKHVLLLVEDNPDDELLTLRAFRRGPFSNEVVVVHDGAAALDYVFAHGAYADRPPERMPELILLDLRLPKIDGLEVLRRLRASERARHLPVVVLTTSDEDQDIRQSYDLGANSYIRKPVDFTEFSETIQQLAAYWLSLNIAPPHGLR